MEKLYNHLDGQKAIQLIGVLLQKFASTANATNPVNGLTVQAEFGFNQEINRLIIHDGTEVRTVPFLEDILSSSGNVFYVSTTEPTGAPTIGVAIGDAWYNPLDGYFKVKVDGDSVTNVWVTINDSDVNYLMPKITTATNYPPLSVVFYSSSNPIDPNVSNGTDTGWINDTNSDILTGALITGESDMLALGFTKILGSGSGVLANEFELLASWVDSHVEVDPTPSISSIERSGDNYIVTFQPSVSTVQMVKIYQRSNGEEILTDFVNGFVKTVPDNTITLSFIDGVEENCLVRWFE